MLNKYVYFFFKNFDSFYLRTVLQNNANIMRVSGFRRNGNSDVRKAKAFPWRFSVKRFREKLRFQTERPGI